MYTVEQRRSMASEIIDSMREQYKLEGEDGDFEDGLRHLTYDASDSELQQDYDKWCKHGKQTV